VIKEITPHSEPVKEADAAGLDPNATPANMEDTNNTANTADIPAAKIEDLEAKIRALQDEVRGLSKNRDAAISSRKRMVDETNKVEADKMHSAKRAKTDSLGGHKVNSDNVLSKLFEDSRPQFSFGSDSSNLPLYYGTPAPQFSAFGNGF
jgi:hypothetical protein